MATSVRAFPAYYSPIASGYQDLTVSNTAVGLTVPSTPVARCAIITVETDQVRFTVDTTTPTSSKGHLLNAGDLLELGNTEMLTNARFIRVTTDATLRISYFGGGV